MKPAMTCRANLTKVVNEMQACKTRRGLYQCAFYHRRVQQNFDMKRFGAGRQKKARRYVVKVFCYMRPRYKRGGSKGSSRLSTDDGGSHFLLPSPALARQSQCGAGLPAARCSCDDRAVDWPPERERGIPPLDAGLRGDSRSTPCRCWSPCREQARDLDGVPDCAIESKARISSEPGFGIDTPATPSSALADWRPAEMYKVDARGCYQQAAFD